MRQLIKIIEQSSSLSCTLIDLGITAHLSLIIMLYVDRPKKKEELHEALVSACFLLKAMTDTP